MQLAVAALSLALSSPLRPPPRPAARAVAAMRVELQEPPEYGRGEQHLSACLEEGDLVAYQVGTWMVDSVEVGDGSPARIRLAVVDHTATHFLVGRSGHDAPLLGSPLEEEIECKIDDCCGQMVDAQHSFNGRSAFEHSRAKRSAPAVATIPSSAEATFAEFMMTSPNS